MENNKLIAEFMGMTTYDNDESMMIFKWHYFKPNLFILKTPQGDDVIYLDELKYHESWDWLMPVIDKCYQEHMSKHIAEAVMTCNIDEAYKVVVEFIKELKN